METNHSILITVYALNPYWGSEQGMGWQFIYNIADEFNLHVVTRLENKESIEKYIYEKNIVLKNVQFHYFDFSNSKRWNKSSFTVMLHYYLWQYKIVNFIKKENIEFDLCHNLNFHNDWTPSFLYKFKKPLIWGPIGHHSKIPKAFFSNYNYKIRISNYITWLIKKYFWTFSFPLRRTIKSANHIFLMNSKALPPLSRVSKKISYLKTVGSERFLNSWDRQKAIKKYSTDNSFTLLCIGRFEPIKGIDIAIRGFKNFLTKIDNRENVKFKIVGKGSLLSFYEKLINELDIKDSVEIIKWMPREDLNDLYTNSHIFLFPSHEGAGMVVVEALANGLPIICLDNEGPGEIVNDTCSFKINSGLVDETVNEIADKIFQLYTSKELCIRYSINAYHLWEIEYQWMQKGKIINNEYKRILNNEISCH